MNAFLYSRVSTTEQADKDLSLPAQLESMRAYAKQHGWNVLEEFIEPGVSGKTTERPALQRLLARVRAADTNVSVVLVHKIDRLARNVYDHATIKALLAQRQVRLASVVENMDDSVSGQLVENIMASIAQFYSANLGEEAKKGMLQKIKQGGWPHKPTRGYVIQRDSAGRGSVVTDPATAPAIRRAFVSYATGLRSLWNIQEQLSADGIVTVRGRALSLEAVRHILKNPFYAGRLRWHEAEYPGAHEPLVTPEVFAQVQRVLTRRQRDYGERGRLQFLLRGFAYCGECKSKVTAERHGRFAYYRCVLNCRPPGTCRARYSNVEVAHREFQKLCERLILPDSIRQRILEHVDNLGRSRLGLAKQQLASATMQRSKLLDREAALADAFASGDVSLQAYKLTAGKLRSRINGLDETIAEADQDQTALRNKVTRLLDLASSIGAMLTGLTDQRRKDAVRVVFKRIVLEEGQIVSYDLHPPFDSLLREDGADDKRRGGGSGGADHELTLVTPAK